MAGKLNRYQMASFEGYAPKVTKLVHLSLMFGSAPQRATDIMVQLYALNVRANGLNALLSKYPTKLFDTADDYTWDVVGNVRRNIPLVEARDEDGTVITSAAGRDMVGAAIAPFELVFPEAWFFDGEVILGDFNEYPIRILGDGRTEGANTVYTVELMGGAVKGMPKELLMPGKRFSYEYAPVEEELSRKAGGRLNLCHLAA